MSSAVCRLVVILFMLWLGILPATAQAPSPNQNGPSPQSGSKSQEARSQPKTEGVSAESSEEAETGKRVERHCKKGDDDRESDLCAQWKAADAAYESAKWTRWGTLASIANLVLSLGGLIALVVTLRLNFRGVKAAEDAVLATQTVGKAQIRPYISVSASLTNQNVTEERPIYADIKIVNTGQTPAFDCKFFLVFDVWKKGTASTKTLVVETGEFSTSHLASHQSISGRVQSNKLTIETLDGLDASNEDRTHRAELRFRMTYKDVFGQDHETRMRTGLILKIEHHAEGWTTNTEASFARPVIEHS